MTPLVAFRRFFLLALVLVWSSSALAQPGTPAEPIRYVGLPKTVDQRFHDGQLRPVVGVHSFQAMRANKEEPPEDDGAGNGYNHAPMLAYWNDRWFLQYLASEWHEHGKPTQTYLLTSDDGRAWSSPRRIFPAIEYEPGKFTINHQRMGFFVAPNGRLLTLAFYGIPVGRVDSPNSGVGIGRAVREINKDGSFGPIHFIRAMPHAGYPMERAARWYPSYADSPDPGFREACEALLANKLVTQQWWEEDRAEDGFFVLSDKAAPGFSNKALSAFRRRDGTVVGLWKDEWAALTTDEGRTWSTPVKIASKPTSTAKEWGQRTPDGRFALLYNPMPDISYYRYPLAVLTSDDGVIFDRMLVVQPEVPVMRLNGHHKDRGSNYVRGISEGDGIPPGTRFPVAYSLNKEDIWVSHIPSPIEERVDEPVRDTFDAAGALESWNIYSPLWAPVDLAAVDGDRKVLRLRDREPHDYAKVVRVFPETQHAVIEFDLNVREAAQSRLEFDLLDGRGNRALWLVLDSHFRVFQSTNGASLETVMRYKPNTWMKLRIEVDCRTARADLYLDGEPLLTGAKFYQDAATVERLEFRTGYYRREMQHEHVHRPDGAPIYTNADTPVPELEVWIDDVIVR